MVDISEDTLTDAAGNIDKAAVRATIDRLAARAERDHASFSPPPDPPDESRALSYLQDGVGNAIGIYILLRTGGRQYQFGTEEFHALERAMNQWFQLYAACYDIDIESDVSIRTAAEVLLDTEDLQAVAEVLTGVSPS